MSFLRHQEIFPPMGAPASRPTPPLIVWMSFRLAIPWRVALQQGPAPLRQPFTFCMQRFHRTMSFHRTACCGLTGCLSRGVHSNLAYMGHKDSSLWPIRLIPPDPVLAHAQCPPRQRVLSDGVSVHYFFFGVAPDDQNGSVADDTSGISATL